MSKPWNIDRAYKNEFENQNTLKTFEVLGSSQWPHTSARQVNSCKLQSVREKINQHYNPQRCSVGGESAQSSRRVWIVRLVPKALATAIPPASPMLLPTEGIWVLLWGCPGGHHRWWCRDWQMNQIWENWSVGRLDDRISNGFSLSQKNKPPQQCSRL